MPTVLRMLDRLLRSAWPLCAGSCWVVLAACGAAPSSDSSPKHTSPGRQLASTHDWTRFGWNAGRSSASTDETGITAANVSTLQRQQVTIDGTVDSSPIYLHAVRINGGTHSVFFVTTIYGKTIAIDADDGTILWRYTPAGYNSWAGSRQI